MKERHRAEVMYFGNNMNVLFTLRKCNQFNREDLISSNKKDMIQE